MNLTPLYGGNTTQRISPPRILPPLIPLQPTLIQPTLIPLQPPSPLILLQPPLIQLLYILPQPPLYIPFHRDSP